MSGTSPSSKDDVMPLLPITSLETIRKCSRLELCDSDVFICSYPKSGTTWMQHIVLTLLLLDTGKVQSFHHVSELAPFYEIDAHWEGDELASWIQQNHRSILNRRVFNTHLRFPMLPSSGGKFIYIVRSPLDVCVSFYHHLSNQLEGGFDGSFDSFFDDWLEGRLAFGSWMDHVHSYLEAASSVPTSHQIVKLPDGRQLLFVTYEDMIRDLSAVLKLLNNFLNLTISDEKLSEVLPTFSFEAMKADIDRFQPKSVHWKNDFCFLRNGKTGSSDEIVSIAQKHRFYTKVKQSGLVVSRGTFIDQWIKHTLPFDESLP